MTRSLVAVAAVLLAGCDTRGPPEVRFERIGDEAGFRFRHELPAGRLDSLPKAAMGGLAVIDADGDGRQDLYFVSGGWDDTYGPASDGSGTPPEHPAQNRMLRNRGDMTFDDVTDASRTGDTGFGLGACVGDIDNDGDVDLFVSNYGGSRLFVNRGDGTFEDRAEAAGIAPGLHAGATFLDYDRDGFLDLFVGQYVDPKRPRSGMSLHGSHGVDYGDVPPPAAYEPMPAFLYHNRGDGTFEDVTLAARVGAPGKAMGVLATDVDDDGWVDVFVANDAVANFVWRNRGDGTFEDAAAILGLAFGLQGDARGAMGIASGDMDGDGRLDYLVPDTIGGCVYVARKRHFAERANDWGLPGFIVGMTGWTDIPLDVDNDGRIDIYKTHGELRTLRPQLSLLLQAEPGGGYVRAAPGPAEIRACARGGVAVDLDDDGRQDLVVVVLEGKAVLLANRTENAGNWVRLRLEGRTSNRMALGARVTGRVGERSVVGEVGGSTGYISAGDPRLHFGLGAADEITDVVVRWPSGESQSFGTLAADREWVLVEGAERAR